MASFYVQGIHVEGNSVMYDRIGMNNLRLFMTANVIATLSSHKLCVVQYEIIDIIRNFLQFKLRSYEDIEPWLQSWQSQVFLMSLNLRRGWI